LHRLEGIFRQENRTRRQVEKPLRQIAMTYPLTGVFGYLVSDDRHFQPLAQTVRNTQPTVIMIEVTKESQFYVGGIWKRRFYSKNAASGFRPHYSGEI